MHRLIINADDLGINSQRSHGIFMAAEQGVVTSASLIVNMPDSDAASKRAQERDLPTGLHLNLTTGAPISKPNDVKSLLTTDGYFLGRETLQRKLREEEVDPGDIEREARAQIEWFLEHRGVLTHVDSHHHIHIHPFVLQSMTSVLDRYGVSFVRIPSEPSVPFGFMIDKKQSEYIEELSHQAEAARKQLAAIGIRSSDNFRGLTLAGNASMRNMRHVLNRVPEGITEWMVHPGSPNPSGEPFDRDPQRQTELNILMSDDTREEIASKEFELCSYADVY